MTGAHLAGDPLAVLPVLYHLLWRHTLTVELRKSLLGPAALSASSRKGHCDEHISTECAEGRSQRARGA